MKRFVPGLAWLSQYDRTWLRPDLIAALTVWALLVPEAMAYASLAGVPPEVGLYAAPLALLGYAFFGSSRQLSVGPTSTIALMSAAVVAPLAGGDTRLFIAMTAMLAIIAGVLCVLLGLAKAGALADFMSGPVMRGFIVGLAIHIAVGQLDKLLGFEPEVSGVFRELWYFVTHLGQVNVLALAIGVASVAALVILGRVLPKLPAAIVVMALAIVVSAAFKLDLRGLHIVGEIPAGLPTLGLPDISFADIGRLVPGALGVAVVAFAESVGAGVNYARKHKYALDVNREFIAVGVANIGAGISQGFAVNGGLSKSAAADSAGQKSQMASILVAVMVVVTILWLTPLFYYLPEAALGAVVIHAVWGLIEPKRIRRYWSIQRLDFWSAITALIGVLVLGVLQGLLLAVLLSLLGVLRRASSPHSAELGRIVGAHGEEAFVDIADVPEAQKYPGLIVYRFDHELFFANANRMHSEVTSLIAASDDPVRVVILDAEAISDLDVTATDMVRLMDDELSEEGITLVFARARGQFREVLGRAGLLERFETDREFGSVRAAVDEWGGRS